LKTANRIDAKWNIPSLMNGPTSCANHSMASLLAVDAFYAKSAKILSRSANAKLVFRRK
jgi:hypothetical protein